ncbi:uncharacterized protein LOC127370657 isoform X4 [Dicentrarchus labrax]|uniref:uncharacterized protein LOC127370657 isoform X4 n=1 Tax=Dicentrarchus labrax TaxID=13489 RepID=UPI0021F66256|nr:uncharacterized protein LOC127370657 isoform X4 [Dicentrarchus labrax]
MFGSGTKLYVTDEQIVKPVVSVYPAASRAHLEGKSSLLCVASDMFPPLVRFSWKRQKDNGPLEKVTSADKKQLKLRESGRTTSMLLIPQRESGTYKYYCSVQHEGGTVKAQIEQEVSTPPPPTTSPSPPTSPPTILIPAPPTSPPPILIPAPPTSPPPILIPAPPTSPPPSLIPAPPTSPPPSLIPAPPPSLIPAPPPSFPPSLIPAPPTSPPPLLIPAHPASAPSQYQVKLLCLMYTVLIVKSLVYCCGLSLLMILRNKGPSTNCTHAVDYDTDCVG